MKVAQDPALPAAFFSRPILEVCPELLGQVLWRQLPNGRFIAGIISEIEAYCGTKDRASHAFGKGPPKGDKRRRCDIMFGPAGHWYVYLCYGIHEMLNIVTEEKGSPTAILIRGTLEVTGPGRLTKQMSIDRRLNGLLSAPESGLWISSSKVNLSRRDYERTARIGVDYAGPLWAKKPYRFVANTSRLQKKLSQVRSVVFERQSMFKRF